MQKPAPGRIIHYMENIPENQQIWPAIIIKVFKPVDDETKKEGSQTYKLRVFDISDGLPCVDVTDADMVENESAAAPGKWWWPERD